MKFLVYGSPTKIGEALQIHFVLLRNTFTKEDNLQIENYDKTFQEATMPNNRLDAVLANHPVSEGSYVITESAAHARLPTLDLPNFEGDIFG